MRLVVSSRGSISRPPGPLVFSFPAPLLSFLSPWCPAFAPHGGRLPTLCQGHTSCLPSPLPFTSPTPLLLFLSPWGPAFAPPRRAPDGARVPPTPWGDDRMPPSSRPRRDEPASPPSRMSPQFRVTAWTHHASRPSAALRRRRGGEPARPPGSWGRARQGLPKTSPAGLVKAVTGPVWAGQERTNHQVRPKASGTGGANAGARKKPARQRQRLGRRQDWGPATERNAPARALRENHECPLREVGAKGSRPRRAAARGPAARAKDPSCRGVIHARAHAAPGTPCARPPSSSPPCS